MTRRQARPSKQRNKLNPRITLVDELKAIEYVDDDYRLKEIHDTIEEDAFNARQRRRSEILGLLATETPCCPKHSVKMVCPKCRFEWRTQDHYEIQRSTIKLGQDGRTRKEKWFQPFTTRRR